MKLAKIMKYINKVSNKILSLFGAILYVGIGNFLGIIYWTNMNPIRFNETLGEVLYLIFLPCTFFTSIILFTERSPLFLIMITQSIIFLIVWGIFYFILWLIRNDKN